MEFDKKEFKKRIVLKIETRKRNIGNDRFFLRFKHFSKKL